MNRAALLATSALLAACTSGADAGSVPPDAGPAPESPCIEGFALDADGACVDVPGPATCPPGSRPRVGSPTCEPVGWQGLCPFGFVRDASSFTCEDTPPAAACTLATREAVTGAACEPVGDCTSAFESAGAIVVDASFADGALDGAHFRTIAEGVAAAADGGTVLVAAGTYDEALTITRKIRLTGRCAAKVEIRSPAGSTKPGIDVRGTGIAVDKLTLSGHVRGISVARGAQATIGEVVVRKARYAGLYVEGGTAEIRWTKVEDTGPQADGRGGFALAAGEGAHVIIEDSALTGGVQGILAGGADTKVDAVRVVVTKQAPDPASKQRPIGVFATAGARASVADSVIRDLAGDAGAGAEDDGLVLLRGTVVRDIHISGSAARGYGLLASFGGHVATESVLVTDIENNALLARDEGSTLDLKATTVRSPVPAGNPIGGLVSDGRGGGVAVTGKGKATLDGVAVLGAWGVGVYVDKGGSLEMSRSLVDATRGANGADPAHSAAVGVVVLDDASATLADVAVTRSSAAGVSLGRRSKLMGNRLLVRDVVQGSVDYVGAGVALGASSQVELEASAIDHAVGSGVFVTGGEGTLLRLAHSSIHGTRATREGFGHGVVVRLGARMLLEGSSIVDNPGIGVVADDARGVIDGATIARNGVGIHAQAGSYLVATDDTDSETLGEGELRVTTTTRFSSNTTRVGSGVIPLPSAVLP